MKASVILTERFQTTLVDVAATLATAVTREHAEHVVAEILAKAQSLTEMPRRGRIVPEVQDDQYRELIVARQQYRLVYRTNHHATVVEVLFVFYAPRGFPYEELIDAE